MKQILFVDDETRQLEELKTILDSMRGEWHMQFSPDGPTALAMLSEQPVDVIVADMHMPGMDGADLLRRVSDEHPQVARIIMSEYPEKEAILRSVQSAHQYLWKPCNAEEVTTTIRRVCYLRDLLQKEPLQRLISKIESLPTLPSIYGEIMAEIGKPDASFQRIGDIISQDMGMMTNILKIVNSAYFGLYRQVSDPAKAVTLLGIEMIKALVLSVQVFSQADVRVLSRLSLSGLWKHGMTTALFARTIADDRNLERSAVDQSFMCGLLHDVGKLILATNFSAAYETICRHESNGDRSFHDRELDVLGTTHAEVGAYLTGLWGLPDSIVEAIAFHHNPGSHPSSPDDVIVTVHVADALAHELEPDAVSTRAERLNTDCLERLDLLKHLDGWRRRCRDLMAKGKD